MQNPSAKLWILIVVLLAAFIVGGSYFYTKVAKRPFSFTNTLLPSSANETGLQQAQKLFTDYPQLVKKAIIQQEIQGTLKAITENSWTVEAGGKTLTLTNQSKSRVRYIRKPAADASASAKVLYVIDINPQDVKVGDLISITQIIDWKTGKTTISGITVLPR